ncbi:MAG: acyltransferase [Gammaproteobacteria bacterium]|nr:acyltransferase [Gammaproteobacteria bacterium]
MSTNRIVGRNKFYSPVLAVGDGSLMADGANFGVPQSPGYFNAYQVLDARSPVSSIKIKKGTWINNGAFICAEKTSIEIGENCLIGYNFFCVDSDFHSLSPCSRLLGEHVCKQVVVEDNVFIGSNVTILKGVRIGENSVIGAGLLLQRYS